MTFNIEKYNEIIEFIHKNQHNFKNKIKIVAISKNISLLSIKLALNQGIRIFGENRVQEAIKKYTSLKEEFNDLELHLVGQLQTNKVKLALTIFDIFHTLDREKLALEFIKHFPVESQKFRKKLFIQVNTGMESQKAGVAPSNANEFINFCRYDLKLPIIGLMCIPPINEDPESHFIKLRTLAKKSNLEFLSMGMSSDFETALLNRATHIRIGTLLFGKR